MVNARHILLGSLSIFIGVLIYITDRPADHTYFLNLIPANLDFQFMPNVFGLFGDFLPSFFHVAGFALLTAGIMACGNKGYIVICLFWTAVNGAFEVGQKYSIAAAAMVPDWFEGIFILDNTKNYFTQGTYSNLDMTGIIIGASVAFFILTNFELKEEE